jgi:tetratricopeptide (TPR) repeat protein
MNRGFFLPAKGSIFPAVFFLLSLSVFAAAQSDEEFLFNQFEQAIRSGNFTEARRIGNLLENTYPASGKILRVRFWLGTLESTYDQAEERLEDLARDYEDTEWARLADLRLAELAYLEDHPRDAVDALRRAERRARDFEEEDPLTLAAVRLELARAYLASGRESSAESILERIEEEGRDLPPALDEFRGYLSAVVLWHDSQEKDYWRALAEFEDLYPKSEYLPSLLWTAATWNRGRKLDPEDYGQELLRELLDFYPDSPEALMVRQLYNLSPGTRR